MSRQQRRKVTPLVFRNISLIPARPPPGYNANHRFGGERKAMLSIGGIKMRFQEGKSRVKCRFCAYSLPRSAIRGKGRSREAYR